MRIDRGTGESEDRTQEWDSPQSFGGGKTIDGGIEGALSAIRDRALVTEASPRATNSLPQRSRRRNLLPANLDAPYKPLALTRCVRHGQRNIGDVVELPAV